MGKVIVISLDAFGYDCLRKTRFLREYAREWHKSRLETMFGYTVIPATVVSGRSQEEHGVWVQFTRAQGKSPFGFARFLSPLEGMGLGGFARRLCTGIFVLKRISEKNLYFAKVPNMPLRKAGKFDLSMKRDFACPGSLPVGTIFDALRGRNIPFESFDWPVRRNLRGYRVEMLSRNTDEAKFECFMRYSKSKSRFFWLKFWELDSITHRTGTGSGETREHIKQLDHYCERIVEGFSRNDPEAGFIFWSDHGMVDVKRTIDVIGMLDGLDVTMFLDGALARFWAGREERSEVEGRLEGSGLRLLSEARKRGFGINPDEKKYGNLIYYCDPGALIFPNNYNGGSPDKAMHGYDPGHNETCALFIRNKKSPAGVMKMADVYKEMLSML